ncbi:MAG TPA: hypothetical protein VG293_04480 [Solirubrobacteraceae bacterium]|nr:hypothetical protein [Solirubrobacteraceae bacterium]
MEKESLLFSNDDFSWSEPPQRRRRRITESSAPTRRGTAEEPIRVERRAAVLEYEPDDQDYYSAYEHHQPPPTVTDAWDQPTAVHSQFDEMMEEWNANYGSGRELKGPTERAFDLSDPGVQAPAQGARRTVLISGHGDERYLPAPRRRRSSELRFHERSSFSPDRFGLWAVLMALALVIGAVAH